MFPLHGQTAKKAREVVCGSRAWMEILSQTVPKSDQNVVGGDGMAVLVRFLAMKAGASVLDREITCERHLRCPIDRKPTESIKRMVQKLWSSACSSEMISSFPTETPPTSLVSSYQRHTPSTADDATAPDSGELLMCNIFLFSLFPSSGDFTVKIKDPMSHM